MTNSDKVPTKLLVQRAIDLFLYIVMFLIIVLILTNYSDSVGEFGVIILLITFILDKRQSGYYSKNTMEQALISGSYICTPIHHVAKIRDFLSKQHYLFYIAGTLMSCWSLFK